MPSPFPGMDPYLEEHWGDVHTSMITYARNQLQKLLPEGLRARVEERVMVTDVDESRPIYPDIRVSEADSKSQLAGRVQGGTAVVYAKPTVIEVFEETKRQTFVEIREVASPFRVVTILEVLSPSNKRPGRGRSDYVMKQADSIAANVSLVEIDLIRQGDWTVSIPQESIAVKLRTPYRAVVRYSWRRTQVDYYAIPLSKPLPTIAVPLRPTDEEAPLDLQKLLDQCYEDGGYDDIDYSEELKFPLPPAEAKWTNQMLRKAGKRAAGKRK